MYLATMLCVPVARTMVVQLAVRMLDVPVKGLAEQPPIDVPRSVNLTLPVGAEPVTVATKVTLTPRIAGLSELAIVVVVVACSTTCATAALTDDAFVASPP
jgi:hypothetical protein